MCKIIFNQKVEFQKIQEFFGKYLFFGFKEEVYIKGIITMNISNYSTIIMEKYLKNFNSFLSKMILQKLKNISKIKSKSKLRSTCTSRMEVEG